MKIQGPHLNNINTYKNQLQRNLELHQKDNKKDHLNISSEAKQLQEAKKAALERSSYVQKIKKEVRSGNYQVNYDETAKKMIDYWTDYS